MVGTASCGEGRSEEEKEERAHEREERGRKRENFFATWHDMSSGEENEGVVW